MHQVTQGRHCMRPMRVVGKDGAASSSTFAFHGPVIRSLHTRVGDHFTQRCNLGPNVGFLNGGLKPIFSESYSRNGQLVDIENFERDRLKVHRYMWLYVWL